MKVLQTFQKTLSFVVTRDASISAFNYIWVGSFFLFGMIFMVLFLLLQAETFQDYSETFYPLFTILIDTCIILIYLSRKTKIFALIDELETIIEQRRNIYHLKKKQIKIYISKTKFCRFSGSRIKAHLWKYKRFCGKMVQNHPFCAPKSDFSITYIPVRYLELFFVFQHWFGPECVFFTL